MGETKFKVGDRVRIREFREEYRNQSPGFMGAMKELCGVEFTIDEMAGYNGWVCYKGWKWHEDWLEFVEDEEEFDADIDPDIFDTVLLFTKG